MSDLLGIAGVASPSLEIFTPNPLIFGNFYDCNPLPLSGPINGEKNSSETAVSRIIGCYMYWLNKKSDAWTM